MSSRRIEFFDGFSSEVTPSSSVVTASSFYIGSGSPSSELGNESDVYLDTDSGNLYIKGSSGWSFDSSLTIPASGVVVTPYGNVSATDVQAAIEELEDEKLSKSGGTVTGSLTIDGDFTVNGTSTTVNTATLDVEDANITINSGGDQSTADSNTSGITVSMTDATDAVIGYDSTTTSKFIAGESGSESEIVTSSHTQVLTNKDIDGGTSSDSNRITLPKNTKSNLDSLTRKEASIVYGTDTKKAYIDDGTALVEVGSGSGQGGINYLENDDSNFKLGTGDWTGDTNLVISHETVSPLRGDGSLKISKGAVDASSQEVTTPVFTVDDADLASVIVVSFDYDFSDSNYSDGDARIEIEFDPNGTPSTKRVRSGEDIKGGKGTHYASFQTDATITDYKVKIVWQDTGTSAVEAYIDNVIIAPNDFGALVNSEDLDYIVVSGAGTQTIGSNSQEQVSIGGGTIEIQNGSITLSGNDIIINRSSNYLISGSIALTGGANSERLVCQIRRDRGGSVATLTEALVASNNDGTSSAGCPTKLVSLQAGDRLELWAKNDSGIGRAVSTSSQLTFISVAEQPNTASILKALGGSEVYLKADGSNTTVTGGESDVVFTTITEDTTGSFDGTNFIVPETGVYIISFGAETAGTTGNNNFISNLYVNGSFVQRIFDHRNKMFDTRNSRKTGTGCILYPLNKDDSIKIVILDPDNTNLDNAELSIYKLGANGTVGLNGNNNFVSQTKSLSTDFSGTGIVSGLTFNNLEIGKKYRMVLREGIRCTSTGVVDHIIVFEYADGTDIQATRTALSTNNTLDNTKTGIDVQFTATQTSVRFNVTVAVNSFLRGSGTLGTYATLTELPENTIINSTKFN